MSPPRNNKKRHHSEDPEDPRKTNVSRASVKGVADDPLAGLERLLEDMRSSKDEMKASFGRLAGHIEDTIQTNKKALGHLERLGGLHGVDLGSENRPSLESFENYGESTPKSLESKTAGTTTGTSYFSGTTATVEPEKPDPKKKEKKKEKKYV